VGIAAASRETVSNRNTGKTFNRFIAKYRYAWNITRNTERLAV
jgi:hypothetical protein